MLVCYCCQTQQVDKALPDLHTVPYLMPIFCTTSYNVKRNKQGVVTIFFITLNEACLSLNYLSYKSAAVCFLLSTAFHISLTFFLSIEISALGTKILHIILKCLMQKSACCYNLKNIIHTKNIFLSLYKECY